MDSNVFFSCLSQQCGRSCRDEERVKEATRCGYRQSDGLLQVRKKMLVILPISEK
jgi:hypothetical protein